MKKVILYSFIFYFLMAASDLCRFPATPAEIRPVKIACSFYPMYIMAKNVAADIPGVSVVNLTPLVTGCLHDYSLTADEMKTLADADVLVANGTGMESFLSKIAAQYPKLKVISLSDGLPLLKGANGDNPHVWVSVSLAIEQVKSLARQLQEIDRPRSELYEKNAGVYVQKLVLLREKMQKELASYRGRKIITFHEAFPYFAREFGLEIAAVVEREPGSSPNAKELAETIDLIKKTGIRALFSEPQYPNVSAELIARETGAKVYVLDPAVTGPDEYDAYIRIMEKNLKTLNKALKQGQ
jgi:zinc transport system substrate-binding protein